MPNYVTPTVGTIIHRLLPAGSRPEESPQGSEPSWELFPRWPPDLFAVAATLAQRSGCYVHTRVDGADAMERAKEWVAEYRAHGLHGTLRGITAAPIERTLLALWQALYSAWDEPVLGEAPSNGAAIPWHSAAMTMLAISDEACKEIGFNGEMWTSNCVGNPFALEYHGMNVSSLIQESSPLIAIPDELFLTKREPLGLHTSTACKHVPPGEACVLPKSMVPRVGCTIRSHSHHLALLPPVTEVRCHWIFGPWYEDFDPEPYILPTRDFMNILLVPFPYVIKDDFIEPIRRGPNGESLNFLLKQKAWMPFRDSKERVEALIGFLIGLMNEAAKEVGDIHGIVFPELALDYATAVGVSNALAWTKHTGLESLDFFISGVLRDSQGFDIPPTNMVFTRLFPPKGLSGPSRDSVVTEQKKHHRWLLDGDQISRYKVAHLLDPRGDWWEWANISERGIRFHALPGGLSMAVLICEDLARIEPVQPAVRAIGPTLLVSLLMDGPQIPARWSARYATVFADDPGSAVLTLTSLGMVLRSQRPYRNETSRAVALLKDPWKRKAVPIELTEGYQAIALRLQVQHDDQTTDDHRRHETPRLVYADHTLVTTPGQPPEWARTK